MSKRKIEMHHYRQALLRMRQGDSDRDIARSGLMGRRTAASLRSLASERGWQGGLAGRCALHSRILLFWFGLEVIERLKDDHSRLPKVKRFKFVQTLMTNRTRSRVA